MSVIAEAFKNLSSNLEITATEQATAIRRHHRIRDHVRTQWDLIEDFLTGSYRRHTKTKPMSDVDVFVVIDPDGPQGQLRYKEPHVVLDELKAVVNDKWPDAVLDGMAVVIPFGTDSVVTSIEVVPAFERSEGGWVIPDPDRSRWLATNPKDHHKLTTSKNQECDGNFVPFVKMVKAANRELGGTVTPSFLLEVMAHDIVRSPYGLHSDELVFFFANAADRVHEVFDDPAGLGGDVNTMTAAQRAEAQQALGDARRIAERAVDLADAGSERAAVKEWQKLFGTRMSNP
ncbi:hypothetical protein GCM10023153_31400 [Ornithinibacter aureus]|uniref:Nucleotidyltransferase n=1 Tax=Ornithinibacter aureus TaxID=622664 RepID=A0ABP8K8X7_9MICO|nr:CBASS oligonucleotide cyclase [Ornithinibacter aureus]KAF0833903.1 nucleotidyltransferase-like protein [Ornithinibacter aureus]